MVVFAGIFVFSGFIKDYCKYRAFHFIPGSLLPCWLLVLLSEMVARLISCWVIMGAVRLDMMGRGLFRGTAGCGCVGVD
jgi:hypothetical protein